MPRHVYCCAECGEIKTNVVVPKLENCSKAPFHRWINMGVEGTNKYECNNCNALVSTVKQPVTYGCKEHIFHEWKKV
jgi:hypothetical protein